MPDPNPAALEFLETRRSRPAKTLRGPAPSRVELRQLLTIAARSPDHGKLEPWRFLVLEKGAMTRLAGTLPATGERLGIQPEKIDKSVADYANSELAVAIIASPVESPKIPEIEQTLSVGAVCMQLLNAALAAGWGANWLSGWASHDREWREEHLSLASHEWIAGLIHIGTESATPPDRPRPDLDAKTDWVAS